MAARTQTRNARTGRRRVNSYRTDYTGKTTTTRRTPTSGRSTAVTRRSRVHATGDDGQRDRNYVRYYVDGTAVRKLDEAEEEIRPRRVVSRRTQENRRKAASFGLGYIFFLTAVCIASVYFCIHYLQLRSDLINQNEQIASMQSTLSQLKEDNDALYRSTKASVSMDDVRETALSSLDLHYATESQIVYYDADDESYVRQFTDVNTN